MERNKGGILPFLVGALVVVGAVYFLYKSKNSDSLVEVSKGVPLKRREERKIKRIRDNGVELSSRLAEVYKYVSSMDGVSTSDLLKKFKGVTDRTLRRDMNKLIDMELITKSGSTKSSKYYSK